MRIGDRVQVTEKFRQANGNVSALTGELVAVIEPRHNQVTLSATNKPCRRTHKVKLDKLFLGKHEYLTFCREDLCKSG